MDWLPTKAVLYQRNPRFAGKTKWSYWRLWNFALEGIISFTSGPLKIATYIGLSTSFLALVYAVFFFFKALIYAIQFKPIHR